MTRRPRRPETLSFGWDLLPTPAARPEPEASPPQPAPEASPLPPAPEASPPQPASEASSPQPTSEASLPQPASEALPPPERRREDAPVSPVPRSPPPPPRAPAREGPVVLSVAQLGRALSRTLERNFADAVLVEGEVSGARPAPSGHLYFALKDEEEDAVVDVVVYRMSVTPRARALVRDGARVRVRGRPTFWSPRGRLQFVGDRVEPTGKGALLEALERLKQKLAAEGLFAAERKRPIPPAPRVVGVVTSAAGAVIHDVCTVAARRGGARILLAPAQVQGAGAAESVRRALAALERVADVDVIIVGRGGGSQDDLLAFQDEELVRAVAACRVPVVSAVGHETDVSLVDFAADARAATPSQAAEMVVPDAFAQRALLAERTARLHRAVRARVAEDRATVTSLAAAFRDPRLLIATWQQRLDDALARMTRTTSQLLTRERELAQRLGARLSAAHPRAKIAQDRASLATLTARIEELTRADLARRGAALREASARLPAARTDLAARRATLGRLAGRLDAMSPLAVLARGYAIATHADGRAVRAAAEVSPGDHVRVRVAQGAFEAAVTRVTHLTHVTSKGASVAGDVSDASDASDAADASDASDATDVVDEGS